jgi:hypothetical protein
MITIVSIHQSNVRPTNNAKLSALGKKLKGIKQFALILRSHVYIVRRKYKDHILLSMRTANVKVLTYVESVG